MTGSGRGSASVCEVAAALERAILCCDASELEIGLLGDLTRTLLLTQPVAAAEFTLRSLLDHSGLGTRWNHILNHHRAGRVADRLAHLVPGCRPRVLDVFSGTGTVATVLRARGWDVLEVERRNSYGLSTSPSRWSYEDCRARGLLRDQRFDAALVVTALHHEFDLDDVLGWLSTIATTRIVVVENLRTTSFVADLHQRFDWFFNHCLNSFGAACPGWYWTRSQWELCLSALGNVDWVERDDTTPGIPFPYDYFVVTSSREQRLEASL